MIEPLSSKWGGDNYGINQHLIAKLYAVDENGKADNPNLAVAAPLTDGNLDMSFNWQSAFENSGTDSKLPAISQLLQSGQASIMLNLMSKFFKDDDPNSNISKFNNAVAETAKQAAELTGRTGITKLNSRQVFSGMPPIKIPITMYFRAWSNPLEEVETPVNQLFEWALPQNLADNSILADALQMLLDGKVPDLNTLFPSEIPRFVALEYGGRTFKPLVIESIAQPLVLPRSKDGEMLSVSVQLTLATLTAWGKDDYFRSLVKPAKSLGDTNTNFDNFV